MCSLCCAADECKVQLHTLSKATQATQAQGHSSECQYISWSGGNCRLLLLLLMEVYGIQVYDVAVCKAGNCILAANIGLNELCEHLTLADVDMWSLPGCITLMLV